MFPPIFDIVTRLAKKYNLAIRLSKKVDISLINRFGLFMFYPKNKKKAIRAGVGIIESYETNHKRLNKLMRKVREGEIIVHPGIRDERRIERRKELNVLLKNEKR
jgi:predicted glycoside hydrolase/deacetylase ChbG (UPF0249 family)